MNREQFFALLGKGADIGSKGASQAYAKQAEAEAAQAAQAADLKRLITGKDMDAAAESSNFNRNKELADESLRLHPTTGVNFSKEGVSYSPKQEVDPMGYKAAAMQARTDARELAKKKLLDDKVKALGDEVQQQEIPSSMAMSKDIFSKLPKEGEDFKSAGPIASWLPNAGVRLGELIGALPKGATEERGAFEAMKQLPRHKLYGGALMDKEAKSFEESGGFPAGATSDQIRANLNRIKGIESGAIQNIKGQFSPEVQQAYVGNNPQAAQFLNANQVQQAKAQGMGGMAGTAGAIPKSKTIVQDGFTYTLNPQTGEYE